MTEEEAWRAFVAGAVAWSEHLGTLDKIKFATPSGVVYVTISRANNGPASFTEVNERGDVVVPSRPHHG